MSQCFLLSQFYMVYLSLYVFTHVLCPMSHVLFFFWPKFNEKVTLLSFSSHMSHVRSCIFVFFSQFSQQHLENQQHSTEIEKLFKEFAIFNTIYTHTMKDLHPQSQYITHNLDISPTFISKLIQKETRGWPERPSRAYKNHKECQN